MKVFMADVLRKPLIEACEEHKTTNRGIKSQMTMSYDVNVETFLLDAKFRESAGLYPFHDTHLRKKSGEYLKDSIYNLRNYAASQVVIDTWNRARETGDLFPYMAKFGALSSIEIARITQVSDVFTAAAEKSENGLVPVNHMHKVTHKSSLLVMPVTPAPDVSDVLDGP